LPAVDTGASEIVLQSGTPVAFVRPGGDDPQRVVLVLSREQAANPGPAAQLAAAMLARLHASGLGALVVAGADVADRLLAMLGGAPVERAEPTSWPADHAGPADVVIIPGGQNGVAAASRAAARAEAKGATVVAVADRDALSIASTAAEGLGVVSG
jgi:hypothetical protein